MLDMIELGMVGFRGLEDLPGLAKRVGSKPAFVFLGEKWGREEAYRKLQNILVGKRQGPVLTTAVQCIILLFLWLDSNWL